MTKLAVTLSLVAVLAAVHGLGGRFRSFNPELLANLGYGAYADYKHSPSRASATSSLDLLESLLQSDEDGDLSDSLGSVAGAAGAGSACTGRRCSANDHCCSGTLCVDLDGSAMGTCLPHHNQKSGSSCQRNADCEGGLVCASSEAGRTCQPPAQSAKQYNEECSLSAECDASRGLCCQVLRRYRQAPRKACSYFRDPFLCIGPVAPDAIKEQMQHTANEKRLTGRAFVGPRD